MVQDYSKNLKRGRSGLKGKKRFAEFDDFKPLSDEEFEELLNVPRKKYRKPKIRY